MSAARRAGLLLWLSPGLLACAAPQVGEVGPRLQDTAAEESYRSTLEAYTDEAQVYAPLWDGKDTRMFAAATYQSWAFREARVRRVAAFQAQPAGEVDGKLAAERADAEGGHEFLFGAHLNDSRYDDFDRKDSIWRLALVTEAGEVTPLSVRRLGRADLSLRALYPYLGDFWVAYWIRFPKAPAAAVAPGSRLVLRVASALGWAELRFPAL